MMHGQQNKKIGSQESNTAVQLTPDTSITRETYLRQAGQADVRRNGM
jgi:hypothetical protein